MQSQFTDKAQNALAQASDARSLKQGYIGTEHILVGLLKEDTGGRPRYWLITVWRPGRSWT